MLSTGPFQTLVSSVARRAGPFLRLDQAVDHRRPRGADGGYGFLGGGQERGP
jgi:hypothetical protein